MSINNLVLTPALAAYCCEADLRDHPVLAKLRADNAALTSGHMQINPNQGQFMALLVQLLQGKRTLDVGTFTGYSALVIALAIPDDGRVVACELNEDYAQTACQYWQRARVQHKIDLRIGPALATLQNLLIDGEANQFDFAFIDADKMNYANYFELCLQLVKPGGLIVLDNMLQDGKVADPEVQTDKIQFFRRLNAQIRDDERVVSSLLPIADGVTLAMKK